MKENTYLQSQITLFYLVSLVVYQEFLVKTRNPLYNQSVSRCYPVLLSGHFSFHTFPRQYRALSKLA